MKLQSMRSFFLCICTVLILCMFYGCQKDDPSGNSSRSEFSSDNDIVYEDYHFLNPEKIFELDYTPEKPENPSKPVTIKDSSPSETTGTENTSVIPGIRKLSEYKIKYADKRLSADELIKASEQNQSNAQKTVLEETKSLPPFKMPVSDSSKTAAAPGKAEVKKESASAVSNAKESTEETVIPAENGPLVIKDWGPKYEVPGEVSDPQFYVEFSLPVKPLASLDEPSSESDIMTLSPPLKGVFRWYGSRYLSFEASEQADPSQVYTITVSSTVKSLGGKSIEGNRIFNTEAAELSIEGFSPGQNKTETVYYDSSTGLPEEYAKYFLIRFNYQMTEDDASKILFIKEDGYSSSLPYTAAGDFNDGYAKTSADKKKTNTFYVTINEKLHTDTTIYVNLKNADGSIISGTSAEESYYTLKPFVITDDYKGNSNSESRNEYIIEFNQNINEKSVLKAVSVPGKRFNASNFSVEGSCLIIHNLDLDVGETYTVKISTALRNTAGYNLSEGGVFSITVPEYSGYANFIDSGARMMEAQFPHKILFEYMNAFSGSAYEIRAVTNPLDCNYWDSDWEANSSGAIELNLDERNTRQFVEIDLDPYLDDGRGFVRFDAEVLTQYYDYYGDLETSNNRNAMTVQVTDLGVTMRLGINKAVVMVRSLSTDKPVEGASVSLYDTDGRYPSDSWYGKTDKDGLAVLPLDINYFQYLSGEDYYSQSSIAVLVKKDNDMATFYPNNHNSWNEGVSVQPMGGVFKTIQRTFMFCDRGLYKPEETVTFRGIDRNQEMGSFVPYTGGYTVRLVKYDWYDRVTYEEQYGETSPSGGFWGSFTLPSDLDPGTYMIEYERDDKDSHTEELYFTVAYFERVKYQASVAIPEKVYYSGDTILASIEASYLGGGKLSNAEYDASWYYEPWPFEPDNEALRSYTFGINNRDEGREFYQSGSGELSNNGTAELKCETYSEFEGSAYLYKVEAEITDESNQNITASQSVLVHPAQFYLGIGKPMGASGFAKKNQKLDFPYIFISPEGEEETESTLSKKLSGRKKPEVLIELTREYWTVSYQNSVNHSVYARYSKNTEIELKLEKTFDEKGTFSITPKNSGYYTLRVSTGDRNNNTAVTEYSFYVTGSDSYWWSGDTDSLSLTPDQSQYNPGDTAQILLQSPLPAGTYLITVEREGIFTEEIRMLDSPSTVIEIPIARNYVPVVYVSISSYSVREGEPVHEYGETDLGKPKGYYGVTPLFINPYVRAFSVDVECDKTSYRPGDTATITLTATKGGKPLSGAELTVMAVDRGVLDLINYHVPNPIDFFYDVNNFPLRVRGGDSRALLMDPVTYSIKSLQGGDEESKEEERKDFRPTAFFEPALLTGKDGTVTCSFVVPDSLTTFRVTAFGVKDELLALQENEFRVQNPVNVQSVQPRRLRVRDTAECGVLITNLQSEPVEISVSAAVRAPQKNTKGDDEAGKITVPGSAFIDGPSSHTITVAGGNSSVVYFDVGAEKQGTVELVYTIQSDILNEKLVSSVIIEKTYVMETVALTGSTSPVESGKTSVTEGIIIPSFAEDGEGSLSITLDPTRLGLLASAVDYVFKYPYGCLEQQSSQVLPLVLFEDYIDVFGFSSEVSDVHKCVCSFFKSWENEQLSSGGFPYWPGGDEENYYVSLRIAHIYAIAQRNGYSEIELPINIEDLTSYLYNEYGSSLSDYMKAYSYYVFTLLNDDRLDNELRNFTEQRKKDLTVTALAGIAWSLKDTKEAKDNALKCADYIRSYMRPVTRSVDITQPAASSYRGIFYNQRSEQLALIMQLFVQLNPQDEMVDRLLFSLLSEQSNGYWTNTAVTARVMESVDALIKMRKLNSTNFTASADLKGTSLLSSSFKGLGAKPVQIEKKFLEQPVSGLAKNTLLPLNFTVEGTGTLFYTAQMKYALPDEMQSSRDEGVEVSFQITDSETGEVIKTNKTGVYTITLESGKTYNYELSLNSTKDRTYLAVRAPLPSGAVAVDNTFVTTGTQDLPDGDYDSYNNWVSNKTIYDNEVRYFWDTYYKGKTVLNFSFRASRRGIYPVTPVLAECMYEPEIFGRSDGYLFIIK